MHPHHDVSGPKISKGCDVRSHVCAMHRSGIEMSRDGHLTDEVVANDAAAPADDGRTTDGPIRRRTFAQRQPSSRSPAPARPVRRSSHRMLPRCC
eukprot:6929703-Prymnesium_polylepis.1